MTLRLGISTCPNDTFAFHGLLEHRVDLRGLDLRLECMDIQELNERLRDGSLDVAKASFHAALHLTDRTLVLPVGAALGFGVGPLLLAPEAAGPPGPEARILCPGADTTATLLARCFHPQARRLEQVRFDRIMPMLQRREADYGVVIHEGRFVWEEMGLCCVEDLGLTWERETGHPLPLGGLLARQDCDPDALRNLVQVIRASLDLAWSDRDATVPTMQRLAQEMDRAVLFQHVDLYVNERTRDLGTTGQEALRALETLARQRGVVPVGAPPLSFL